MRFTEKKEQYLPPRWFGKKNKISFEIIPMAAGSFYVLARGENNFSLNTLWNNLSFKTLEMAKDWCEEYKHVPSIS
tara:strand:+ start:4417 stop:4644 length:228 start_codon:yes stop_codon:yes gene_type:complete